MLQYYQKKVRATKAIAAKGIDYKWYRRQNVSETKGVDCLSVVDKTIFRNIECA